jgi:putative endonuclease
MLDLEYMQARKIENHIKRMKSKKYIKDLKSYSELSEKLFNQYK